MIKVGRGLRIDLTNPLPGLGQRGAWWNAKPDNLWGNAALGPGLDVKALSGEPGQSLARQARRQDGVRGLPRLGTRIDRQGGRVRW